MLAKTPTVNPAIEVGLSALRDALATAQAAIDLATADLAEGRQNAAIGAIIDLERRLPEAVTILNAILIFHREQAPR